MYIHRSPVVLLVLIICISAIFSCGSDSAQEEKPAQPENQETKSSKKEDSNQNLKKFFQVKSAKIEYTYSGAFEGKETFYFDNWGNTVVMVQDMKEFGNEVKQTTIWKDNQTTIYKHNDPEKKAWEGRMRPKATEPPAAARLSEAQLKSVGYEKLADETIAGKTCTVYENKNLKVKYWLWNSVELKIINHSVGGQGYEREAVKVEENAGIPESLLVLPEGYSLDQ